jgi:hypothetical protein
VTHWPFGTRAESETHCRHAIFVISEEHFPGLTWPFGSRDHVFGDRRPADIDAKHQEFAMNAWRAPQRVLFADLSNELDDLNVSF